MDIQNYAASFYIGHTTRGLATAVFFDASFPGLNNNPPVTVITGSPGSGKTFFAQTLCAHSAIAGKMTIVIDPKADFISMVSIEDDIGPVTLMRLSERSRRGVIDPFVVAGDQKSHGIMLAKEVISMLTGLKQHDLPVEAINPICADVANQRNPSLTSVVRLMQSFHQDGAESLSNSVRGIASTLHTISQTPFGKLLFADEYRPPTPLSVTEGTTVITMLGVDLPNAATHAEDYTDSNRIAASIMYLISDFSLRAMRSEESRTPKMLIIDEAWAIVQNRAGAKMINDIALFGRSLNISLLLITQNLSHLSNIDVENTISTFFAFRTKGQEGNQITTYMGLRSDDEDDPLNPDMTDLMSSLDPGECLMKDVRGKYSTVKISRWKENWARVFETNPQLKDINRGRRKKKEAA